MVIERRITVWLSSPTITFFLLIMKRIKIVIDRDSLERYESHYFTLHPRAKKKPIKSPQHPSINTYTRMSTHAANNLKQSWKAFIMWIIEDLGYKDLQIQECEITYVTYFSQDRRHDLDNISPKYILDGFVEAGFIMDDDYTHIKKLTTQCDIDKENPRIEFLIDVIK